MNESSASVRTVSEHANYFMNLLDRITENDNEVDNELRQLGSKHVFLLDMGIGVPDLEKFGEIVADAFLKLDGIRQSKEATKAWRMLIASIVDHIRVGFESEVRLRKRKGSVFPDGFDESLYDRRNSMPDPRRPSLSLHANSIDNVTRKLSQM
uniref:Globin family profile domain-containing protein n=1 Tax=Acrobeloides nanus TaxID=290746 RepID=A0A914E3B3_9BILA